MELRTGRVRWETKVSPDPAQYFFHGDVLIANDVIVAGADRASGANVHAFDRLTGKELWKHAAGRGVNGPVAGSNGRAFATTLDRQLLSFAVNTGAVRWNRTVNAPGWEGPGVAGDRVVVGTSDGSVHALSAATGGEEWRVNIGAPVTTSVLVAADDAYVGTRDGSFHRVDIHRGAVLETRKLDAELIPRSVPVRTGDSVLVLLTDQGAEYRALVSVNAPLDRVRWRVAAKPAWSTSRAFVWGDVVVVGTNSGDVTAYCVDSGALAWSRTVKGPVRSIGGAEDILLVGTRTGTLYALRAPRSCS